MLTKFKSEELKGTVDFAIISIREDEFAAILKFFPPTGEVLGGLRTYEISDFTTNDGSTYRAALFRSAEQGHSAAQSAASDVISDLKPSWILLVGIGGAVPDEEFSLGDVVIATRMIDFSITAVLSDGTEEIAHRGAPAHRLVQDITSRLEALKPRLGNWNKLEIISHEFPTVTIDDKHLQSESSDWNDKISKSLNARFYPTNGKHPRLPIVTSHPIGSGNKLIKNSGFLQKWLKDARDLRVVEMELPGVFEAARHRDGDIPVLAIRGISDIVGFKRDPAWTRFACFSAASLTRALLNLAPKQPLTTRITEKLLTESIDSVAYSEPKSSELAFMEIGMKDASKKVIVSACIVSDEPNSLIAEIDGWKQKIQRDSFVQDKLKQSIHNMDLIALFNEPSLRQTLLNLIATLNFSGYIYYANRSEISKTETQNNDIDKLFIINPLVHRFSKKLESIDVVHSQGREMSSQIKEAAELSRNKYLRPLKNPDLNPPNNKKSSNFIELAHLVAVVVAQYLENKSNAQNSVLFEHLRTRIRYVENVLTGEKHTRDRNPLI